MEPGRNLTEQVLELVGNVAAGIVPGSISLQFVCFVVLDQLLGRPLLDDPTDLPAVRIVLDADAHVSEPFPIQEIEALFRELAGLVVNEFGFCVNRFSHLQIDLNVMAISSWARLPNHTIRGPFQTQYVKGMRAEKTRPYWIRSLTNIYTALKNGYEAGVPCGRLTGYEK